MSEPHAWQPTGVQLVVIAIVGMVFGAMLGSTIGVITDSWGLDSSVAAKTADYEGTGALPGCVFGLVIGAFIGLLLIGVRYFGRR